MRNTLIILTTILFTACSGKKEEIPIARAYDSKLYLSDIKHIITPKTTAKDSIEIVTNYINNWIRTRILLKTAQDNITQNEEAFNKQLEDYKNSLIIYAYETELVKQKLDTTISEKEIEIFYENNKADFTLKENIVKVIYSKLPSSTSNAIKSKMKQLLIAAKDKDQFIDFCQKHAVNYYYDDETWLFFNDLIREIPIQTYNQENYLSNNRIIDFNDSIYHYYLNIVDFKVRDNISPLSFEKENIRNIILNKRKHKLINNIHNTIYNDALKRNEIELYSPAK